MKYVTGQLFAAGSETCCYRQAFLICPKHHTQMWAIATLLIASLPLLVKFNSDATAPVTE